MLTTIAITKFVASAILAVCVARKTYIILTKEERKKFFEKVENTIL